MKTKNFKIGQRVKCIGIPWKYPMIESPFKNFKTGDKKMSEKIEKEEKIDKEVMDQVFSGSLTVEEQDNILEKVQWRCNYIVRKAFEIQGLIVHWWDFDNEGGEGGACGYFDPEQYEEEFYITGDFDGFTSGCMYLNVFPTKWIWTDFEDELTEEIEAHHKSIISKKIERKAKNAERKQKKQQLIESALAKLTKEEINALGY